MKKRILAGFVCVLMLCAAVSGCVAEDKKYTFQNGTMGISFEHDATACGSREEAFRVMEVLRQNDLLHDITAIAWEGLAEHLNGNNVVVYHPNHSVLVVTEDQLCVDYIFLYPKTLADYNQAGKVLDESLFYELINYVFIQETGIANEGDTFLIYEHAPYYMSQFSRSYEKYNEEFIVIGEAGTDRFAILQACIINGSNKEDWYNRLETIMATLRFD